MKKIFLTLVLIMFILACSPDKTKTDSVKIITQDKEIKINVELAKTQQEIIKGLMYREHLDKDSGMLFVFPDEDYRSFWMKNTLIPLDMIFIAGNGTIVDINKNFQPCKTDYCPSYRSKERAMYVLEVNAGFAEENNINEGGFVLIQ